MRAQKAARPRHCSDSVEARGVDGIAGHVGTFANAPAQLTQAIRGELSGSDGCSALGITATGNAPVLALCLLLIEAGYDPATPLEAYRGDVLALRVRTIGEGARLRIATHGVGFERLPECTTAPWVRKNQPALSNTQRRHR